MLPSSIHITRTVTNIFLLLGLHVGFGQPATEVYLFDLQSENGFELSNPINISSNPGYDNQPSFHPDGSIVYFVSTRNGQTDIRAYDIQKRTTEWLTDTPDGGEYSPTPMPGGQTLSAIQLEEAGRQLLWQYPIRGGSGEICVPYVKIGYHVWLNPTTLYAFVLGEPATLQEVRMNTQEAIFLRANIGRSLHIVRNQLMWINKDSTVAMIEAYDPDQNKSTPLFETLPGSEDMAWLGQDYVLMGSGAKLFIRGRSDKRWKEFADLAEFELAGITRLAVGPEQKKLCVVVMEQE